MLVIVAAAILGGLAAALFAKICDGSIAFHRTVIQNFPLLSTHCCLEDRVNGPI